MSVGTDLDTRLGAIDAAIAAAASTADLARIASTATAGVLTQLDVRVSDLARQVAALTPSVPPVVVPVPTGKGIGSAWIDTKDNIQMRRNGNGDVAIQLRKRGTGPLTGIRIQDRFGPVYSAGDGGKYDVAAVLGSPDGNAIASVTWFPGTNGGKADAAFPTITFLNPSADVPDGTRFWVRFLNVHAAPDGNYVSMNVLHTYGTDPSPRQPLTPDADLAVLVNTGNGWTDRAQTPDCDVLPNHEGFGYSQCLTGYWKPIGGANQVRQTFTLSAPLTFSHIGVRLRGDSTNPVTVSLDGTALGTIAGIPPSAPGGDNAGQTIGWLTIARTIPAGAHSLVLTAPAGATYTATPARKALKGSYPTLVTDWQSYMSTGGAEWSADGGKTWASMYGNPNQTDLQYAVLP